MSYVDLTSTQVTLAALLILVNGAISLALRLGMERTLAWASVRTVLQLLLIGWVLEWVFQIDRWYIVIALLALMTLIAGITAGQRNKRRFPGIWFNTIVSVWAASWLVTAYALFVVVQDTATWYQPQYAIPLMGMVLGNSLNGTSIGLNSFTDTLVTHREQVEMALCPGRQPLGSGADARAACGAHRHDSHHQHDDGGRHRESARHDDRSAPVGHVAHVGREVPDRDHVSHRVGDRALHGRCRAVEFLSVVQFRAPVSLPTDQRLTRSWIGLRYPAVRCRRVLHFPCTLTGGRKILGAVASGAPADSGERRELVPFAARTRQQLVRLVAVGESFGDRIPLERLRRPGRRRARC